MVAPEQRDEPLHEYRTKRDFTLTPEPSGERSRPTTPRKRRFVVQRHRARRTHYDFRLEVDGVLASWAVPKGPTLDPSVRTLAVQVEDHPLEYRDFEGVIPGGQYGAGDVIVWDRGTYEPYGTDDPAAAIAAGEIHVDLHGEKLRGRFVLVRTRADGARGAGRDQWLMLHKHDDFARPGWRPDDHPRSVKSGRTNDEVAAHPAALWRGDVPAADAEVRLPDRAVPADTPPPARGTRARTGARSDPRPEKRPPPATKASARAVTAPRATKAPARATAPASRAAPRASPVAGASGSDRAGVAPPRPTDAPDTAPPPVTEDELAALDRLDQGGTWELGGRTLTLTNLDKVLFPARGQGVAHTKRDLIRYHAVMAPVMLPYLVDRPVNLHRFPNGVDKPGFWHKQVPSHAPPWLTRWHNDRARPGESEWYAVIDQPAALAWMANFGAVELHPWTSRLPDVLQPTWALIDIDPGSATTFDDVIVLAKVFHTGLEHLGLTAMAKVTGQRGIHIFVPVAAGYSFDQTRAWVEQLSRAVGGALPDLVSWTWEKRARHGLARLDFTQNALNKTLVAPYGVRAAAGAPVSVPIEWEELDDPGLRADRWTIDTVTGRVAERGDPFHRLLEHPQHLPEF